MLKAYFILYFDDEITLINFKNDQKKPKIFNLIFLIMI